MCGSLRHSHWAVKDPIRPGEVLPAGATLLVGGELIQGPVVWNKRPAHARVESLPKWRGAWKEGSLQVSEFTEKGVSFQTPTGAIKVVAICPASGGAHFAIVTRPAETDEERKVHDRFPVYEAQP